MSGIYKVIATYKDESKKKVSIEIRFENGKIVKIPDAEYGELSFGWFARNTAPEDGRGRVKKLLKRFFHIA